MTVILLAGIPFSRRYGPEVKQKRRSDYPMEMLLALGETDGPVHVWFRRPGEGELSDDPATAFLTFFSPRQEMPEKLGPNHYRFAVQGGSVYRSIAVVLDLLVDELGGRDITVHFGWPTSSWLDRMSTGVLVHNLMRLPPKYPALHFAMECPAAPAPVEDGRRAALLS